MAIATAPTMPSASPPDLSTGLNISQNTIFAKALQAGLLSNQIADEIKLKAVSSGSNPDAIILAGSYLNEEQIYQLKSQIYNVPFIKLADMRIPVEILNRLDQTSARKNMAVVFEEAQDILKVAMADPLDIQKVKFLSTVVGRRVEAYFATPTDILGVIDTKYGAQISDDVDQAMLDVGEVVDIGGGAADIESMQADIASAPVARIVNMVLEYAVKFKASDVHIEARETKISVRYRVSGVLSEKLVLPKKLGSAIVSRIKILANLKIDEHRIPQDGRFQIKVGQAVTDLRISIIPSVYGEKVVIRLLEKDGGTMDLNLSGMRGGTLEKFSKALEKTQGIVLVTGPTGSGKTVTLAAALKRLNSPEVNIMTLEDPVEIRLDGITQVQVNAEVGLTFAKGLRSFLRQDPDIIMVGEIRDGETAELATQASLTGHLVLATLHTNSAAGALPRLLDMDIEPFLLASTINLIAAQRLVRRVCEDCKAAYPASDVEKSRVSEVLSGIPGFNLSTLLQKNGGVLNLYKGQGCPKCGDTGFKGRVGIFEAFTMSEKISAMTISHESAQTIEAQARQEGMITMAQDGFLKALEGLTTIQEVMRVIT